jgi:hypothetical protein
LDVAAATKQPLPATAKANRPLVYSAARTLDVSPIGRSQAEEVRRLIDLGARKADVGQGGECSWQVLEDPEGNEFCVLRSLASESAS